MNVVAAVNALINHALVIMTVRNPYVTEDNVMNLNVRWIRIVKSLTNVMVVAVNMLAVKKIVNAALLKSA